MIKIKRKLDICNICYSDEHITNKSSEQLKMEKPSDDWLVRYCDALKCITKYMDHCIIFTYVDGTHDSICQDHLNEYLTKFNYCPWCGDEDDRCDEMCRNCNAIYTSKELIKFHQAARIKELDKYLGD